MMRISRQRKLGISCEFGDADRRVSMNDILQQIADHLKVSQSTEMVNSLFVALGFLCTVVTILYLRRQLLSIDVQLKLDYDRAVRDHARSERQLAREMCWQWSTSTSPETSSVTRLVETLSDEQCDAIANLKTLVIAIEHRHHLINIFQLRFPHIERMKTASGYAVEGQYLLHLRHVAIRYLNVLESILMCWTLNIADQKVIEKEFSYLLNEKEGRTAMHNLRKKIDVEAFPAIQEFIVALRRAHDTSNEIVRPSLAPRGRPI